ncbi:MAG: potassium-transporting ATPase subunit F [Chloroflexi bacterium RBG_19FT_COMBO_62_14]|nr:MAG: potassium-transporting ATPase subunit F [Chloroflexi bacterium RBG_19FT_COMBO_62_14]
MNPLYVAGRVIALGLLVYLMVALLKPEWSG